MIVFSDLHQRRVRGRGPGVRGGLVKLPLSQAGTRTLTASARRCLLDFQTFSIVLREKRLKAVHGEDRRELE